MSVPITVIYFAPLLARTPSLFHRPGLSGLVGRRARGSQAHIVEFGEELPFTYVMGGLARELDPPHEARILDWLDRRRSLRDAD